MRKRRRGILKRFASAVFFLLLVVFSLFVASGIVGQVVNREGKGILARIFSRPSEESTEGKSIDAPPVKITRRVPAEKQEATTRVPEQN